MYESRMNSTNMLSSSDSLGTRSRFEVAFMLTSCPWFKMGRTSMCRTFGNLVGSIFAHFQLWSRDKQENAHALLALSWLKKIVVAKAGDPKAISPAAVIDAFITVRNTAITLLRGAVPAWIYMVVGNMLCAAGRWGPCKRAYGQCGQHWFRCWMDRWWLIWVPCRTSCFWRSRNKKSPNRMGVLHMSRAPLYFASVQST